MTKNGQQKTEKGKPFPTGGLGCLVAHDERPAVESIRPKMNMNSSLFQRLGSRPTACLAALALTLLAGCDRDEIKVYRVAKESPPPKLDVPDGWTPVAPGQMRVASFAVKGADGRQADVSVIPLPGAAGGVFANVNRWRGQVGLPPASETEINQMAEPVQIGGQPAELFDIAGTNTTSGEATRILASIQHRDGMAWFFKMTGDDSLVAQQKPAFVAFLKTFDPAAAATTGSSPHPPLESGELPPGHPDISMTAAAGGEISHEGQPKWEVPVGWKEVPGGQFLVAKFLIGGDAGAPAAVNVSASAGDGGGLAENVNRWRRQLALTALSADDLSASIQTIEASGGKASVAEMSGTDGKTGQPAKLVGVVVPRSGQTWFYKLMGDPKTVEAHKDEFLKFVQSVKY
jgi:hypothetical protein